MVDANSTNRHELTEQKSGSEFHAVTAQEASRTFLEEFHSTNTPAKNDRPAINSNLALATLEIDPRIDKTTTELSKREELPAPRFTVDNMDASVSARNDFYHYADGNWIKNNPIPSDHDSWSGGSELVEHNKSQLHQILENARGDKSAPAGSPTRHVGDFFASAMDTDRLEKLGVTPVQPALRQIGTIKNTEDLFRVLGDLHKSGSGALFSVGVGPDAKDSSTNALELSQGGLTLGERDYYLSDSFAQQRNAYLAYVSKMFSLEGESPKDATKDAATVLSIETELAKSSRSASELRDPLAKYNKETTDQLAAANPSIPWKQYLNQLGVSNAPYEIVGQPEYFSAVEGMLKTHPIEDWKTYLRWQVLNGAAPFLNHDLEQEHFNFFGKILNGQQEQAPRWKIAESIIDGSIGDDLGRLYVDKYFPAQSKQRMNALVDNLLSVYRDHLQLADWMSDSTRQMAVEKLDQYTKKIGYGDKFLDYSSIDIKPDDLFGNVQRSAAFEMGRSLSAVGKPVDKTEFGMTPPTVNAYYNALGNEIVFPAGILQPPFYDPGMDDAVNYGAIGAIIGHEISHGFDDEGRHFDGKGNLNDWWTASDAKEFTARAQKLVDEYNTIEVLPGLHVNGKLTLGENLADLGGVTIAYDALERDLQRDPSKRIDIDGLTPEQRFFISYAQTWRSNTKDEALRNQMTSDPHAPEAVRAVAPLKNLQAFDDAFGIQPGDPMWQDPSQRVKIF